ncbi:hypothetical protein ALC57_04388 [Trachymyrmex cornetzi]|uniref:Uncharacterized protein n=1 Tax=Trachymyrmex cornetzi TaxID=471704 RepID=A0A151JC79_9HYME|nr:hypothetical protein ALC57_04388 [Trachymyrmex cornetzi]
MIGSRSLRKSSYARKQDATKAVGNKPLPMERKNNDSRGREIIGARMEEKEEAPFYRSFREEESQATPTHEIDPMINFQSRLNYAGRLSPIEEASPDSERAVCVVQKKRKKRKKGDHVKIERERGRRGKEKMREIETASQSSLQPSNKRLFVLSRRGLCPRMRTHWCGDERVAARRAGVARIDAGHDCQEHVIRWPSFHAILQIGHPRRWETLDDASAKTDGTDRYRQTKCTAAPGSGSALRDSNGKKQDPTRLKCKLTVKFIARHVSSDRVSGKHDCPANRNSHTEISRNRAETKGGGREEEEEEEEAVPLRSLSRKLAKEDGESFHLRAASEVGANGGLKSFAIERRRNHSSLSEKRWKKRTEKKPSSHRANEPIFSHLARPDGWTDDPSKNSSNGDRKSYTFSNGEPLAPISSKPYDIILPGHYREAHLTGVDLPQAQDTSRNNHRRGTMFILRILVEARSIKRPSCR